MSDHWDTIARSAQMAPGSRRLKAYAVLPDGTRVPLDAAAIVVELDDDRGLVVSLSERRQGEGVAVRSLPQGDAEATDPSSHSLILMRSGGANLLYLSPERLGDGNG